MAKDGDIIETMFGWMVSLVGWILGGIVKLIITAIGALFGAIVGLFNKQQV